MTDVLSNQTMKGKTMEGKTVQAGLPWLLALMCLFVLSLVSSATAQDTKVQAKGNVEILIKGSPLRGFAIAQILSRIGATSQAEEPVLSQVLSVPK